MSKTQALVERLQLAEAHNLLYQTFQHYRGGVYFVEGLVIDTDDGEVRVEYSRVGGPDFDADAEAGIRFVRKLPEFLESTVVTVEDKQVLVPRFRRVKRVETWVAIDEGVESE